VFRLVTEVWQRLWSVLERRQARRPVREESEGIGSPLASNDSKTGGDPTPTDLRAWFVPECLADLQQMWESSQSDPELLADLRRQVPEPVLRHLGLAS
jgi:hypothetical protein